MAGSQVPAGAEPIDGPPGRSPKEAAEYIAALLEGLRKVALQSQLPFLAYLLTVALEEANIEKGKQS